MPSQRQSSTWGNAGELIRKMGLLSVEGASEGLRLQAYINNYEIENYFLKGIGMVNDN